MKRSIGLRFATSSIVLLLGAPGCETAGAVLPDEASALSAACEWDRDHRAYSKPTPGYGACGFTDASLKGGVWAVRAPFNCIRPCVGGDTFLLLERRTGRVVRMIVGE